MGNRPTPKTPTVDTANDFDAWWVENTQPTIPLKLMGRTWDIPGDPPAAAMLRLARLERAVAAAAAGDDSLVLAENLDELSFESILRGLVGDDLVDQWLTYEWTDPNGVRRTGVPNAMLQAVSGRVYQLYNGDTEPADAEAGADVAGEAGKAPAETEASTSSPGS